MHSTTFDPTGATAEPANRWLSRDSSHRVQIGGGTSFVSNPGETLLDAALRQGIVFEHSCTNGRCGSCKGRLSAGSTATQSDEPGLSPRDRDGGWVLTCVRTARSDLTLDIEVRASPALIAPRTWPCRIQALSLLAPDVLQVSLRLPPGSRFKHHAGQHVDLVGPEGLRRAYSLAHADCGVDVPVSTGQGVVERPLILQVRRVPAGAMSRYWFEQARVDDLLRLKGPLGSFALDEVEGLDLVFLATGTGFAPVSAMLASLATQPARARSLALYWGGRVPSDLYRNPSAILPGLHYVPVLSRADASWTGVRGHVQQALLTTPRDWSKTVVFACGSPQMVDSAREQLSVQGLQPRHFRAEAFVASSAA